MNKLFTIIGIFSIAWAVNSALATSKKKVTKKVFHITTVEDGIESLDIVMTKGKLEGIKIPVRMASGYSWALSTLGDNLKQPFKPRVIQANTKKDDKEVNNTEYQIFYVRAVKEGKSSVKFEYKQPFDKEAKPEKEITLNIEVK